MSEPSFALQTALVAALAAAPSIRALVGDPARVYDDPPRHTSFPYITLGNATIADWDTATERGHEHGILIHVWSRYGGRKEVKEILGAIYDTLHDAGLSLAGNDLVNLRFEFADVFRDADGETMHGVARYRATTEPV